MFNEYSGLGLGGFQNFVLWVKKKVQQIAIRFWFLTKWSDISMKLRNI